MRKYKLTQYDFHRRQPRSGAVIIAVIALLGVAAAMFAIGAKSVVQEHRQAVQRERAIQSRRMAEAGLELAQARFASDDSYDGEVWDIVGEQIGGSLAGQVSIRLEESDSEQRPRAIVTAVFPIASTYRVTTTIEQELIQSANSPDEVVPNGADTPANKDLETSDTEAAETGEE